METSALSAAMSGPVVAAFEAGAVLGAAEVEEPDEVAGELAGAELLELELDEHAARSSAAPTAVIRTRPAAPGD